MNFRQLRKEIEQQLLDAQIDDAKSVATFLITDTMNWTTAQMLLHDADTPSVQIVEKLSHDVAKLSNNMPLQYVTNKAYFCGHTFYVDEGVLIPRPETEEIVSLASLNAESTNLLDIGTGSGCIALSIKKERPDVDVTAIDISADALIVAQKNMVNLGVKINLQQVDILSDNLPLGSFDTIVSNPPYICYREQAAMHRNVLDYEPHKALFVPDTDPLLFYRRIIQHCYEGLLNKGGRILFEVNELYADDVAQLMDKYGFFFITKHKDMYGKWRICHGLRRR